MEPFELDACMLLAANREELKCISILNLNSTKALRYSEALRNNTQVTDVHIYGGYCSDRSAARFPPPPLPAAEFAYDIASSSRRSRSNSGTNNSNNNNSSPANNPTTRYGHRHDDDYDDDFSNYEINEFLLSIERLPSLQSIALNSISLMADTNGIMADTTGITNDMTNDMYDRFAKTIIHCPKIRTVKIDGAQCISYQSLYDMLVQTKSLQRFTLRNSTVSLLENDTNHNENVGIELTRGTSSASTVSSISSSIEYLELSNVGTTGEGSSNNTISVLPSNNRIFSNVLNLHFLKVNMYKRNDSMLLYQIIIQSSKTLQRFEMENSFLKLDTFEPIIYGLMECNALHEICFVGTCSFDYESTIAFIRLLQRRRTKQQQQQHHDAEDDDDADDESYNNNETTIANDGQLTYNKNNCSIRSVQLNGYVKFEMHVSFVLAEIISSGYVTELTIEQLCITNKDSIDWWIALEPLLKTKIEKDTSYSPSSSQSSLSLRSLESCRSLSQSSFASQVSSSSFSQSSLSSPPSSLQCSLECLNLGWIYLDKVAELCTIIPFLQKLSKLSFRCMEYDKQQESLSPTLMTPQQQQLNRDIWTVQNSFLNAIRRNLLLVEIKTTSAARRTVPSTRGMNASANTEANISATTLVDTITWIEQYNWTIHLCCTRNKTIQDWCGGGGTVCTYTTQDTSNAVFCYGNSNGSRTDKTVDSIVDDNYANDNSVDCDVEIKNVWLPYIFDSIIPCENSFPSVYKILQRQLVHMDGRIDG